MYSLILSSLLDHNDIVDLMADVATYMPPQPQSVVQPHSLRQLSPEFQLPPMVSGGLGHRGNQAETEIPLVVSDPYLFEMPSGMQLQQQQSALAAPPPGQGGTPGVV